VSSTEARVGSKKRHNNEAPQARPSHTRTQQQKPLETILEEQVLSGNRPTLNLDDCPETQEYQEKFAEKMNHFQMFWCQACRERNFSKVKCKYTPGKCKECDVSRKKHSGIATMSSQNDMYPYPNDIRLPPGPQMPNQVEEMLLGRIFPIMRVFHLGNGEIGYKGSILNIEQDASPIFTRMPVQPNQYPFLIIRKPDNKMPYNFREFRVHRDVMLRWLMACLAQE
jgi:hypothetical protein